MKLSIIIPYFNTKEYTDELLDVLDRQVTDDVEVILIDDGSESPYLPRHDFVKVKRVKHSGQSKARNLGLNIASGDYIQFIDSDDLVSGNFIERILEKANEGRDLIEFSWRSLNTNGAMFNYKLTEEGDRLSNPSVCTRTFKREYIGNIRFNEQKDATEDEDFSRRLGYLYKPVTVSVIPDYLYFYRTDVQGSNVKTYKQGFRNTKRIVYYFEKVTKDRKDILRDIKEDDKTNEVILMTYENEIPELKRWCQILRPCTIWTHYLKGEPYRGCSIIHPPIRSEVILFIRYLNVIGGIETFIRHFSKLKHEITLVTEVTNVGEKLGVKVVKYSDSDTYSCDTLVMLRILDPIPQNFFFDKVVRMCHGCRTNPNWHIPHDWDVLVNVSEASKKSFGSEAKGGIVIHNPITKSEKEALILVSATRIPAVDKGQNEQRMRTLASMLEEADIPYIWFNFSDGVIQNAPRGMVNMGIRDDIQPYVKRADYLVQLSDSEAWSYSILEALVNNTAVLVTPFPSTYEMGIEDGKNGYILPYDMGFDLGKILHIPKFEYEYSEDIEGMWEKVLKSKPKRDKEVPVFVTMTYMDIELKRTVNKGEVIRVSPERAKRIVRAGFGRINHEY
jgi:glycosyltransferase involved in cell wall biosynthesis